MDGRPTASVIVPFAGPAADLPALVSGLRGLSLAAGDEVLVGHNAAAGERPAEIDGVRIVPATRVRAPGHARNCAASAARGDWLVFIDADTRPSPSLLDSYFSPPPAASTAVLAGGIVDIPGNDSLAARHSVARGHMSQRVTLDRQGSPYAQTANCAVRRDAFDAVGGFNESIVAGEDADLCFRLARAGWHLEERPEATVGHRTRGSLRALLRQLSAHGAGAGWLNHRYPREFPPLRARQVTAIAAHGCAGALSAAARGDRERAAFALLDFITIAAFELGRRRSNHASAEGIAPAQAAPEQR